MVIAGHECLEALARDVDGIALLAGADLGVLDVGAMEAAGSG